MPPTRKGRPRGRPNEDLRGRRGSATKGRGTATLPGVPDPPPPSLRSLALRTAVALFVLMASLAVLTALLREPVLAMGEGFVARFGGPGIALGWFLPDAVPLPLIPDAFSALGLLGGMGFGAVVAWASAGSLAGGLGGYWIGTRLRGTALAEHIVARGQAEELIARYGAGALAAATLTPLPYSAAAWACGAGRMPLRTFVAVSGLRVVRVSAYLLAMKLGVLDVLL